MWYEGTPSNPRHCNRWRFFISSTIHRKAHPKAVELGGHGSVGNSNLGVGGVHEALSNGGQDEEPRQACRPEGRYREEEIPTEIACAVTYFFDHGELLQTQSTIHPLGGACSSSDVRGAQVLKRPV